MDHNKKNIEDENEEVIGQNPDFKFFVTTLALQAAIFLGVMENPVTKKREKNLPQAKFIINTLDMLNQKTLGNLTSQESETLEKILRELKTQYEEKNHD